MQFKQAYPANFRAYESACRHGEVRLGRMFTYETGQLSKPWFVINFPTKGHWRSRSKLSDIKAGLADLRTLIRERNIRSIAVPPLGCGNGGLGWRDVRPMIMEAPGDLPGVHVMVYPVMVYPPQSAHPADSMPVGTQRPRMSAGRAALLILMRRYIRLSQLEDAATSDGASLLEIQKLMYFLREGGQQLGLNYPRGRYGPYAENLSHVPQALEGHYLRGYGDRTEQVLKLSPILLLPGAADEAQKWLDDHTDDGTVDRVGAVIDLVSGFASTYGVELLATVHWTATRDAATQSTDPEIVTGLISNWNERKGRLFTEAHVSKAIARLDEFGWVAS